MRLTNLKTQIRYVYVIECQGRHKIGIALEPTARLDNLQGANPFPLRLIDVFPCPGKEARKIESMAHRTLRHCRIAGEWFDCTADAARDAVKNAFFRQGVLMLDLQTLGHKLAVEYLKRYRSASPTRRSIAEARVAELIDPALN